MTTRLKITFGAIQLEYEGDAAFDHDSIVSLLSHIQSLAPAAAEDPPGNTNPGGIDHGGSVSRPPLSLHVNAIATKLGVANSPDLAIAAAAHLQLVQQKERFTRQELLDSMRAATAHYKKSMASNLTQTITSLTSANRLNEIATDAFSLTAPERQLLESKLA